MLTAARSPRRCLPILALAACLAAAGCASDPNPANAKPELAVVRVLSGEGGAAVQGLGFLVSPDGLLVTCQHVADNDARGPLRVELPGGRTLPAARVQADAESDLAILRIAPAAGHAFPYLRVTDDDVEPRAHVRVLGPAGGATHGTFDHWEDEGREMAITARLGADGAGAPLLGDDGRVIGIALRGTPGGARAAPTWRLTRMMPQLTTPPRLGVRE